MKNLQIKVSTVIERAIYYDKSALTWYKYWQEKGEQQDNYCYKIWKEYTIKAETMLELLNLCEPSKRHYIVNGELVTDNIA